MFILDTDTFSNLPREGYRTLQLRIAAVPKHHIWISAVTVEESVKGTLSAINTERKRPNPLRMASLYCALTDSIRLLASFNILEYTAEDEMQWAKWAAYGITKGRTMDCRIAASAVRKDYTVVTSNVRDFKEIPGVKW